MLNNIGLAETVLLNGAKKPARSLAAQKRLDDVIKERRSLS
jgi:hypothetical protein